MTPHFVFEAEKGSGIRDPVKSNLESIASSAIHPMFRARWAFANSLFTTGLCSAGRIDEP